MSRVSRYLGDRYLYRTIGTVGTLVRGSSYLFHYFLVRYRYLGIVSTVLKNHSLCKILTIFLNLGAKQAPSPLSW